MKDISGFRFGNEYDSLSKSKYHEAPVANCISPLRAYAFYAVNRIYYGNDALQNYKISVQTDRQTKAQPIPPMQPSALTLQSARCLTRRVTATAPLLPADARAATTARADAAVCLR